MIETYQVRDTEGIIDLWNRAAVKTGYKEMDNASFKEIFTDSPYFNKDQAFVLREEGRIAGFACGCMGDALPLGKTSGYFTCAVLEERYETSENYRLLIEAVENTFRRAGKRQSEVLFFNPMMLPWYIRGTDCHEHNNAPGVFKNSRLYQELLDNGYLLRATEEAMYLNLESFEIPEAIREKEVKAAGEGYEVAVFDKARHHSVEEMLKQLDNPLWEQEIGECTREGVPVLVAAREGRVVGFAGPMIRQKNGRGYFTGIGVVKEHEGHGLGTILFYKLCKEEKAVGAGYMSLYTGADNPAGKIYRQAGFVTVQEFAVMRKML
jgi:ribosomal protein S18 acetylase RimI-like enzyme